MTVGTRVVRGSSEMCPDSGYTLMMEHKWTCGWSEFGLQEINYFAKGNSLACTHEIIT